MRRRVCVTKVYMYHRARWVLTTCSAKQLLVKVKPAAEDVVDEDSQVGRQWSCTGGLIRSAAEKESELEESSQEKKPWKIIRRSRREREITQATWRS